MNVISRNDTTELDPIAASEARVALARQAFDDGVRHASEASERVVRNVVVPALWGAAVVGGVIGLTLLVRFIRRARAPAPSWRISVERRPASAPLSGPILGALGRFALAHAARALTALPTDGHAPPAPLEPALGGHGDRRRTRASASGT
jgi:hypothetical protein